MRGRYHERIDRTSKEEEVDLSEHEHYTDALCKRGLIVAEIGSPKFRSQEVSTLASWTARVLRGAMKEIAGREHSFNPEGAQYKCL
jgi:hypothetical protein